MRKLKGFLRSAKGLCVIALVALSLVLLLGIQYGPRTLAALGRPTLRIPTPTPLPGTPRAEPVKPLATQVLPTPGVWKGQETVTPQTYVRPSYPVNKPEDVISVILNDRGFISGLESPMFGPSSKGATPGTPIFVKSISEREVDWDYYVVPFYKEGQVSGVVLVGVKDGMGKMGGWSNWHADRYPLVSAAEAKEVVMQAGYQVAGEPRLVHRQLRESGPKFLPFWEVRTADHETIYVIFNKIRIVGVYKSTEVHAIY